MDEQIYQEEKQPERGKRSSGDIRPGSQDRLTVVGIGCSAGGLAALQNFFRALPPDTGMAFVVITHMDPQKESLLQGLLQQWTAMPVQAVTRRVLIEPDHVYVIAPNQRVLVTDTHLDTQNFDEPVGLRTPIDFFFRSLATFQDNAIAIILSGAGADGAVGVKAVKEWGGLLFVQDPTEATDDSMPLAAIETGLAVNQPSPRLWTKEEVALVEETAERTWAAVEQARAEEALRVSEEKYRTLFDSIDEGFVVAELLFDEEGKPFDLLVLETNASFDRMMRTTDVVGKRAREIFPNAEASWFEAYGRVVETGKSFRFENYLAALESWFDLYISCVGDAGSRRFAIVFNDITERKRLEANLAFLNKVSEDLERLTKVDEIMSALGAKIGEHFGVMRCSFAEIDDAAGEATVRHAWYLKGYVDSARFRPHRLHEFISDELSQTARAGEMMIVRDTRTDPRTDDAAYAPRNTRAFLTMPFLRDGEWHATLSIADSEPRDWRGDEIELMRELTNRIWTRLERARAAEALHESQAQLAVEVQTIRDLYDSSTRLLGMSDINDVLEEFLDSSMRMLGADFGNVQLYNARREVLELVTARGFHPEFIERFKFVGSDDNTACGRAMRSGERIIIEDIKQDALYEPYRQDAAQADYRAVQSTPLVDRQGRLLGMISTHFRAPHRPSEDDLRFLDLYVRQTVDFLVHVRAEEELREHQMQLQSLNETLEKQVQVKTAEARQLASDLIIATQRERQRISHVLHDDLQQRIYAVQMQLSFLQNALQTENESAGREVSEIEKELKDILTITRHLSIDLSPPILRGEGLSHAINWLASRMQQQYGLLVELQADGDFVIPNEDLHVLLFNCVRELLFNVVKHAGVSRATVALQWTHDTLRIQVRDEGKGFPATAPEEQPRRDGLSPSMGLPTIRHQLRLLGGDILIESAPGAGTQVILIVPVTESSQGVSSSADRL